MLNRRSPSGVALIVTLLTLTIFSLAAAGFIYMVTDEQKTVASGADNTVAFYGAEGALENMSAQIDTLFSHTAAPTPTQIDALDTQPPSIPGVIFPPRGGQFPSGGYYIGYQTNSSGGLLSTSGTIGGSGPLAGLQGAITPFTLTVIAQGPDNTEVKLVREVQEVAVPIFEFGIFSNNDLSFFAGPDFGFGGRVATNGNLYLAEGNGSTLTLPSKVTAYQNVIRAQLSNGWTTSSNYTGTVNIVTTPGNYRALAQNEGSLTGGVGSAANPNWKTISLTDYNGNIMTSSTGVKQLNMAIAFQGAAPITIIERAQSTDTPLLAQARLENQASMRILLSDNPSSLPDPSGSVSLNSPFPITWYTVDACHAPLALSPGSVPTIKGKPVRSIPEQDNDFLVPANTSLIGGYIEIDIQTSSGSWQNVTKEILKEGITANSNLPSSCTNHPVIHLERPNRYNCNPNPGVPSPGSSSGPCVANPVGSLNSYDYVPINMYDTREGNLRDTNNGNIYLNGVMNVVELDVGNLQKWLAGQFGSSGALALNNGGYIVYFSDRRGNFAPGIGETGMFGNEDIVNPASSTGAPDGVMEAPEDVDGANAGTSNWNQDSFDTYGAKPSCAYATSPLYPCQSSTPLGLAATPRTTLSAGQAEKNAVIFFRRALRLTNGTLGNLPPLNVANCSTPEGANGSVGFTVAAENPVYLLGDYNAASSGGSSFKDIPGACHVPAAVMGDAVTLLSNSWTDLESFTSPTNPGNRPATTTYYRTAVMGGTNVPFQAFQSGTTSSILGYSISQDFGTDGGVHNFLRMLENWSGQTLYYKGSIADFYYSRQATGVFKCCTTVYNPPTRGYSFDLDFQNISDLPPGTPRFTDVNALGFQQLLLSSQ